MDIHSLLALASTPDPSTGEVAVTQIDAVTRIADWISYEFTHYQNTYPFLKGVVQAWKWTALPVSVFCIIGIIISVDGLLKIRRAEYKKYHYRPVVQAEELTVALPTEPPLATRWNHIVTEVESENESSWRQAIIESDILLEEMLMEMGYQGAGIGERLKRVDPADMKTFDKAGEAHGVRNRIAHDGANFPLTQHEARRVINLYRDVFKEFKLI